MLTTYSLIAAEPVEKPVFDPGRTNYVTKELFELFSPDSIEITDGDRFHQLNYLLFKPVLENGRDYPLVISLNGHDHTQLEYFNVGQLKHLQDTIFLKPDAREKYPFFLLAPQCPLAEDGSWLQWSSPQTHGVEPERKVVDPLDAVIQALDHVLAKNPIDASRISICGFSSGGNAAWELAERYPQRFAAVVPLASVGGDMTRLKNLIAVPVWAFHSSGDNPDPVRTSIVHLQQLGGNAHLTLIPKTEHVCFDEAFRDYEIIPWMLSQTRSNDSAAVCSFSGLSIQWQLVKHHFLTRTGRISLAAHLTPILVLALLYFAIRQRFKKIRKARDLMVAANEQ